MRYDFTPEQIAEMHDRNENFHGARANFQKIALYHEIRNKLIDFLNACDFVRKVDGFAPAPDMKNAMLWVDFQGAASMEKADGAMLADIMKMADSTMIAVSEKGDTRVSFTIRDVWDD